MTDAITYEVQITKIAPGGVSKMTRITLEIGEEYTEDFIAKFGWATAANPIPAFLVRRDLDAA